jgi:hypothetical protein
MSKQNITGKVKVVLPALTAKISGVTTITTASIDVTSASTHTTTTTLPPEVMNQPKDKRDLNASRMLIENDHQLKEVEDQLPQTIRPLLERQNESSLLMKGKNPVFINCSFYGSPIGGDIHSDEMTFLNEWNQHKDVLDIEALKADFTRLIEKMIESSRQKSDFEKVGYVSIAQKELDKANGPGMLKHLKKAGDWVLEVAKDVSAEVIVKLLTKP